MLASSWLLLSSATASGAAQNPLPVLRQSMGNKADVSRLLTPGMSTNQILALLGEPDRVIVTGSHVRWRYNIDKSSANQHTSRLHAVAADLFLDNGRLNALGFANAYDERTSFGPTLELLPDADVPGGITNRIFPPLEFFIVSQHPITEGRFIDTKTFPKLGFISPVSILTIDGVSAVTLRERLANRASDSAKPTWTFNVYLRQQDATRCASVTETNVGRTILITQGTEPIIAATLTTPLTTGAIEITCGEESLRDRLIEVFRAASHPSAK